MSITGIILAGGHSSRMGENKALLKIGGKTVIERIANQLASISSDMIVVANNHEEYQFLGLPMVSDQWNEKGPLAGIHAGLTASGTQKNLIVACDMPFISAELGKILLKELESQQAAVPEIESRLHPLFAAYRKETKEAAEQALRDNRLRIREFLHKINASIMKDKELKRMGFLSEEAHFFNMNSPDEYQMALKMAAGEGMDSN
ncbi:molybdenum cofactor guanylyltransferase [Bacillus sp. ISL-47]|uniref:molybdenum cofactor guanylyltransferase n=1 Tax=Bacillus sp. ISL-47 TaxID=2819130 RepID=UPI001BE90E74|nr:molybdenum cofactor guanylyltransferase [Bacillus sp. ISL-47]MBT2687348.1 molybdenum cofactor guanylyltransferase [Bacillus sp. ISL-47]MBT2706582.1 molybdenum cofactor guanylyltransferase [Pseudomonas sp. ISL-84]